MASLSKADSRRMYSWWWNSHISPKNSKWLQENLTDVDIKVKAMIKLIEEDGDSFARKAEMYYKKRPELMKMVEELYRAYRALAERYDHATGALRQAHKTMTEAFPNQVPAGCEDSSPNSPYDVDPQTPDTRTTSISGFSPDDLQKNGFTGTARKALNFSDSQDGNNKHRSQDRNLSQFESVGTNDTEILLLKEALAKLEDEKEAGLKQYLECLERLAKLESEIANSQQNSIELADRASKAEAEIQNLKDALQRLEFEKNESLELYHRAQEDIVKLNEKAQESENETENLKEEISRLKEERDFAYDQYKQSINMQSGLEKKLVEAEKEIERLKLAIIALTEEKEAQTLSYQKCLETISSLELRLVCAQDETERLKTEIENGLSLLKDAEEQRLMLEKSNGTLQTELESMGVKIEAQDQELTEKQKELGRLWTCIQEERLRFVEAETAFQTLQQLHSQSQEELRSLAGELQNRAQILLEIESRNQVLEGEVRKQLEENKNLAELNLSSTLSLKEMQSEICSLKESNGKLEEEVDLRVDQRNALQQEIYCLKEELNDLNKNHRSILDQVAYVGLNPESLGSSVKALQDENSNLKEEWQTEKAAKAALLQKLEVMGQLLERNVVLENSLSDLGAELEGVRGKLKSLEESYQSLSEEKSNLAVEKANLLGQLQVTTDNLSQVSEKNTLLENSLFDAHVKLEVLKQKSKTFEDSAQVLADEKSALITEKGTLVSQIEITTKTLKDLEVKYTDLEEKYSAMEKERESTLRKVEELNLSLALQNQEHVTFAQKNDKQLHALRSQIQLLQEESHNKSKDFEEKLDKSFSSEIEIFILLKCVQDLEEKNFFLLNDCHKLQEASKLSESLVHVLKQEKSENQLKIKSLADQNDRLKIGMHQLLKVAGLSLHPGLESGQEHKYFDTIQRNFEGTKCALGESEDKNMKFVLEMSILVALLKQLKTEVVNLEVERSGLRHELCVQTVKILELQSEAGKLSETNEGLRSKVSEGDITEQMLRTQLGNLHSELSFVQEAYTTLQMDNSVVLEQKKSLLDDNSQKNDKICLLEEENDIILGEVLSQSFLSQALKSYVDEKHAEMSMVEKKLEEARMENLDLKKTLEKSEHDLEAVICVRDQLNSDLVNRNNLLQLKEKEHKEAVQRLMILENDKMELSEIVAGLQRENNEVKLTKDEQQKQNVKLIEENDLLSKGNRILEEKIHQLTKNQEKAEEKAQFLETEGSLVYGDLVASNICQDLLEEKIRELTKVCMSLQEEITSKDVNTELLKEKTSILESENRDLKAHLAAYGPALESLRNSIISLENHTCTRMTVPQSENDDAEGGESVTMIQDPFAELQDLQSKVKVIEMAVVEMQMLSTKEKLDADAKLESAMKQIEELSHLKNFRSRSNSKPKSTSEILEADPKDIMLDQASESSSYAVSKRGLIEGEIWETADDPKLMFRHHPTASDVSLDSVVDKLEVSKRFKEPNEDSNKRKVLERLNSDVLKLTNLQITIEDLKRKVEITLQSRRGKGMLECETLKGQLMEAESAIQKLYELNGKLVKHIEGSSDKSSASESGESESMRRKKVSEQARRVSEKIGRLQLEIQKIQFVLLKLDDENEPKGKSRFIDTKKRVLLKDYLYGGGRTKTAINNRRKKSPFCACVEPSTKGD
uniref:protein NETWORKED 1D n=1 Tax=Erigeron canadensis TaxID=72917 RepID=UPI001CB8D1F1|nr:protein NETWORKED 1D [Erigeron canadensis]